MESPINSAPQPAHKPSQAPEAFLTHSISSGRKGEKGQWHHEPVVTVMFSHLHCSSHAWCWPSHRNLVPLGRVFTGTLGNILTLDSCNTLMHPALRRIPRRESLTFFVAARSILCQGWVRDWSLPYISSYIVILSQVNNIALLQTFSFSIHLSIL